MYYKIILIIVTMLATNIGAASDVITLQADLQIETNKYVLRCQSALGYYNNKMVAPRVSVDASQLNYDQKTITMTYAYEDHKQTRALDTVWEFCDILPNFTKDLSEEEAKEKEYFCLKQDGTRDYFVGFDPETDKERWELLSGSDILRAINKKIIFNDDYKVEAGGSSNPVSYQPGPIVGRIEVGINPAHKDYKDRRLTLYNLYPIMNFKSHYYVSDQSKQKYTVSCEKMTYGEDGKHYKADHNGENSNLPVPPIAIDIPDFRIERSHDNSSKLSFHSG